ncbi:MAG TPA: hypothetical protein VJB13_02585 [Candidatus Nanoarchaeia archaeon]|nr:hypothetical protein [Candidatus Nanoarchaeia archaeon]
MVNYKLSIEDRIGTGINVTERAITVKAEGITFKRESMYNPNAKPKPFNSDDSEFDTPFSIVHPFRELAEQVVNYHKSFQEKWELKINYDHTVNDAQQRLFENILRQESHKVKNENPIPTQRSNIGEMAK